MITLVGCSLLKGQSTNRPHLFNGTNYNNEKARIKIYIHAVDSNLSRTFMNGPKAPTNVGEIIPKD